MTKYIVLVADGMADHPVDELNMRTPLEAARTPNMDFIVQNGYLGQVKTIPDKMNPASDVANLSIMGYDPARYYSGRAPLEAANLGIEMEEDDVAFRCNLITVEGDTLLDYSAGHIKSGEAEKLVRLIDQKLGSNKFRFFPGVSYRHLLLAKRGAELKLQNLKCLAPHDIPGQSIKKNLPKGDNAELIIKLMLDSREILSAHEINQVRLDLKENPANMIWLWGQGVKPKMPEFKNKFGLSGSVISAVDLLKGLGRILGLEVIDVEGATGYYDTNYAGKAEAAVRSLERNDFVFVHVEAPDEAGHNGDLREKIAAIERFDQLIVGHILEYCKDKYDFRVMVLPDHATPLELKTHTAEIVPFAIYGKDIPKGELCAYNEKEARKSRVYFKNGYQLMEYFIQLKEENQSFNPTV
ncbi:MAG: cofactor-independent phosphoglycerate mutase [Candidatus Omnitrophica bacterium]|jgi:2,3-bisphosphoglycerate-independent phosphoglycerate mutase|nr:cofactor-independent phosphoglycerate mutase [Candidatus Omnitrophota bacterium]MDD3274552.1 cofactor-independent phosphoglycerate mutase [Candidatus Omnitrophota bacterium]MDD5078172.1 cofactor-independent phosphoglycerate mutase [Candidatus Omnitrophota bacterium]MDD5725204.1 cofactor-independent phosphoglycerate mutase [Candidatus Omnitrophota bacterium]